MPLRLRGLEHCRGLQETVQWGALPHLTSKKALPDSVRPFPHAWVQNIMIMLPVSLLMRMVKAFLAVVPRKIRTKYSFVFFWCVLILSYGYSPLGFVPQL